MTMTLDQLLASIDPERTWEEAAARVDEAVNSYPHRSARLDRWDDFRVCLIDFMRHVEASVLHIPAMPQASLDFEWGRCVRILSNEYGVNGEKAAFEMARTGNEGGLYAVLKRVAGHIAQHYGGREVAGRAGTWWDELSVEEQLAAIEEYLAKYGHLLPAELTEGSAVRVKANFPKVLQEHSQMLQRMRRVGR